MNRLTAVQQLPYREHESRQPCLQFTAEAEAELSAFYNAIRLNNDSSLAHAAAEHWLRIFATIPIDRSSTKRSLRRVTIAAASLLFAESGRQL